MEIRVALDETPGDLRSQSPDRDDGWLSTCDSIGMGDFVDGLDELSEQPSQIIFKAERPGISIEPIVEGTNFARMEAESRLPWCLYCLKCREGFDTLRYYHLHLEKFHTQWVCRDMSLDKSLLSKCVDCQSNIHYRTYRDADAHLRRAHPDLDPYKNRDDHPFQQGEHGTRLHKLLNEWIRLNFELAENEIDFNEGTTSVNNDISREPHALPSLLDIRAMNYAADGFEYVNQKTGHNSINNFSTEAPGYRCRTNDVASHASTGRAVTNATVSSKDGQRSHVRSQRGYESEQGGVDMMRVHSEEFVIEGLDGTLSDL